MFDKISWFFPLLAGAGAPVSVLPLIGERDLWNLNTNKSVLCACPQHFEGLKKGPEFGHSQINSSLFFCANMLTIGECGFFVNAVSL